MRMTTKSHNDAILDTALRDATLAVFGHYGVTLVPVGPSAALSIAAHDAVGVIGFTGDRIRGTLVIATSSGLVAHTCHDTGDQSMPLRDRVRDWVGELSNLVLGRVKVALARCGVSMGLSTPVAFTGEHLRLGAVQRARTRAWDFRAMDGEVRVWLEVEMAPAFCFELLPERNDELAEGEPLLF
jgi:CheY-specific phosphatase CheX